MTPTRRVVTVTARHDGRARAIEIDARDDDGAPTTYGALARAFAEAFDLDARTVRLHGCAGAKRGVATTASEEPVPRDVGARRLLATGTRRGTRDAAASGTRATDQRVIGFEDEDRRERARRGELSGPTSARARATRTGGRRGGGGGFGGIEALRTPAGLEPTREDAVELLTRLASDPGIRGVMEKHGWEVGKLCEMPPEGKVGVSESCVLGYNVNAGREIHLRLRTDDLRGFRDYVTIRRTLLHELAHNVHSNHDAAFRELNARLNVECLEYDWLRAADARSTRRAAECYEPKIDGSYIDPLDVMATTKASSGRALGGSRAVETLDETRAKRLARFAAAAARDAEIELNRAADEALREAGLTSS